MALFNQRPPDLVLIVFSRAISLAQLFLQETVPATLSKAVCTKNQEGSKLRKIVSLSNACLSRNLSKRLQFKSRLMARIRNPADDVAEHAVLEYTFVLVLAAVCGDQPTAGIAVQNRAVC